YGLGNLFRQDGNPDTAELVYKAVLEERPDYAYAYSGLAQIQLAQGKTDEAEKLLIKASDIMPDHTFLEQLADIYKATGNAASATGTEALVLKSFAQHDNDGWNCDKEFAAFCCNHDINLTEALQRAEREYNRRPANIDALDTYAWALYKNGRATDALPLIENALRLGTRNPVLHYHAGIIFKAVGERGKSAAELEKAIHINPFIHILYRDSIQQALASMSSLAYSN
ncbi:MAG: tetratricopeptide repeat protein, partial [bacterium]